MAITIKVKKMLHRKSMEMCTPVPVTNAAGHFFCGDRGGLMPQRDCNYLVAGVSAIYNYNADEDAWALLPASGATGTFAAGACGEFRALGAMGGVQDQTATAGTTTTLTTNKTITRNLVGSKIRVISGAGVGYEGTVASNTIGANSVITVTPASSVAFNSTTVFRVWSGSLWFFNAGTTAVGFSVYDRATNAWTTKSVTNLPTAWGTTGQLVSTESLAGTFETGTSTGSNTTTTLNNTGKSWLVNAYTNYQVRITGGTGIGQIRTIASNTATALTVSVAWTVTPDATSVYAVEGNDDFFYLLGNAATTLYKFVVSTNTWSTISPGSARGGAAGAGVTAAWVNAVQDTDWGGATGNLLTTGVYKQNGRYIYSFRGGAANSLDMYDIAANTWVSAVDYGGRGETFTTGSSSTTFDGNIYIAKEATGRLFRFDVAKHALDGLTTNLHPQSTATDGGKLLVIPYVDGSTKLPYLYVLQHTRVEMLRMMLV